MYFGLTFRRVPADIFAQLPLRIVSFLTLGVIFGLAAVRGFRERKSERGRYRRFLFFASGLSLLVHVGVPSYAGYLFGADTFWRIEGFFGIAQVAAIAGLLAFSRK